MKNKELIFLILFCQVSLAQTNKSITLISPIVPNSILTTCEEALAFRKGKLFQFHTQAFDGAKDSAKIARYNTTLEDFKLHKKAAVLALKTTSKKQRQEIMLTIFKAVAFNQLGKVSNKVIKKTFPDLSEAELKTVRYLIGRAKNVAKTTVDNGFSNSKAIDEFVFDELARNAKFIAGFAQLSPFTKLIIIGAETGIDVGFTYWDGEIKKTEAKNEIEIFDKAIKEIITKHPEMKLREINNLKNKIDEECNQ